MRKGFLTRLTYAWGEGWANHFQEIYQRILGGDRGSARRKAGRTVRRAKNERQARVVERVCRRGFRLFARVRTVPASAEASADRRKASRPRGGRVLGAAASPHAPTGPIRPPPPFPAVPPSPCPSMGNRIPPVLSRPPVAVPVPPRRPHRKPRLSVVDRVR